MRGGQKVAEKLADWEGVRDMGVGWEVLRQS